jgi:hypothetical protein
MLHRPDEAIPSAPRAPLAVLVPIGGRPFLLGIDAPRVKNGDAPFG